MASANHEIDLFQQHAKPTRDISCLEVRELHSLDIHIYIFCAVVSQEFLAYSYRI